MEETTTDELYSVLQGEISADVDSISQIDDNTLIVETGLNRWNEYFVKEICRIIIENTTGGFGVSFDEDIEGFNGFTATIKKNSDNPRMYILMFGKYIGLSPSVISSCLEDAPEESDNPVDTAIDTILRVSIDTGKTVSEQELREKLL